MVELSSLSVIPEIPPALREKIKSKTKKRHTDTLSGQKTSSEDLQKIMQCFFLQHCDKDRTTLPEKEWYAMVCTLAHQTGGPDLIHTLSTGYPGYSPEETDKKILHAINDSGPTTCAYIKDLWECGKDCGVKSPAALIYTNKENDSKVREEKKDAAEATDTLLQTLDEKYFVVNLGGKTCVCWPQDDPGMGRSQLITMSFTDFKNLYLNHTILRDGKVQSIGSVWLKSPNRKTYERVVMIPKGPCPSDCYNLWRGFSVEPRKGSWKLLEKHLREVICKGTVEYYEYLIKWMAASVQNPAEQGWAAVVFRGDRGSGKGVFAQYYGRLFGQHWLHITNPLHLTGHFNSHLRDCLCLFVDEAYWAGDPSTEGILKGLVTEREIVLEGKGKDPERYPNRLHILMATNNDWAVPAGGKERRFFVLDINDSKIGDKVYFDSLIEEMNGEGRSALLYDLLQMDLSNFDVRRVPNTEALTEQKIHSLDPIGQYWFMRLKDGTMPSYPELEYFEKKRDPNRALYVDEWEEVKADDLYKDFSNRMKEAGISRRGVETKFGMSLKKLLPKDKYKKFQKRLTSGSEKERTYYYKFPSLEDCRKYFNDKMFTKIDWDEDKLPDDSK